MPDNTAPSAKNGSGQNAPSPCPICKAPVLESDPSVPFCGDRCKTIDLGKWAKGEYVISRPVEQADLDEV